MNPEIAKIIEKDGKVFKFINAKRYQDMGGSHPAGWVPYRLPDAARDKMDPLTLSFGTDASGYVRRGDCILAVRPKELNEKHKAYLRQEATRGRTFNEDSAAEMREFVRASGLDMRVLEGAEANEGFGKDEDDE